METLRIHGRLAKPKGILDPYMGSGSFRIAAWEMGIDYTGIELDKDYFEKEEERFREHLSKGSLYGEDEIKTVKVVESSEGLF
jgi:site-specific DNA-methyltransferase (adenine-specific)